MLTPFFPYVESKVFFALAFPNKEVLYEMLFLDFNFFSILQMLLSVVHMHLTKYKLIFFILFSNKIIFIANQ